MTKFLKKRTPKNRNPLAKTIRSIRAQRIEGRRAAELRECSTCHGAGWTIDVVCEADHIVDCPDCAGTGKF
jgi:DnaJ-class molecular chaperone